MGKSIEQAENWLDDLDEVVLQIMHLINLEGLFTSRIDTLKKNLEKTILDHGYSREDLLWLENKAVMKSNYNSDYFIQTLVSKNGAYMNPVGLR